MVGKISKRSLVTGIIIVLLMMTYSFLFCLYSFLLSTQPQFADIIQNQDNMNFMWVSYGFTMGIFAVAFVASVLAFERKDLRSRVFGVPIVLIGYAGIVIQLALDALFMIIGMFVKFDGVMWIVALIFETMLFIFILLTIIIRQAYRALVIEPLDKQVEKQTFALDLAVRLEIMCENNQIDSLDKNLTRLYENARYCDPVSNPEVSDIEDEINENLEALNKELSAGNEASAQELITKIDMLLKDRKLRLKLSKK